MSHQETDSEVGALLLDKSDKDSSKDNIAPFTMLFKPITKKGVFFLVFGLIFTTFYSLLPLVLTYYVGDLIDTIEDDYDDDEEIRDTTRKVGYVILVLMVLVSVFAWLAFVCACRLGSYLGVSWRYSFFKSLMHKSITWYDHNNPIEVSGQFDRHCLNIEKASGERAMIVFSGIILSISSWMYGFYQSVQLLLAGLGIVPFQIIGCLTMGYGIAKAQEIKATSYSKAMTISGEALENSKTVVGLNAQEDFYNRYSEHLKPTTKTDTLMGVLAGFGWSKLCWPILIRGYYHLLRSSID